MRTALRIWGEVKPYWRRLILTYVCLLAGLGLDLSIPYILRQAIDVGVTGAQPSFMATAGLIVLGIGVLKTLFSFGQRYLSQWLAFRVAYDLKNKLYQHIQSLSFSFHDTAQTGQLMTRCTGDVNAIFNFASTGLLEVVYITVMTIAVLIILFTQNVRLSLIALAPIPILVVLAIRFGRLARRMFNEIMQAVGKLNTVLQENLTGIQVVKGFAREPYEIEKYQNQNQEVFQKRIHVLRYFSINFPAMFTIVFLSTALILYFGGHEVIAGQMTDWHAGRF